ncbi:MAG: SDR family oxidoreductase [Acidimicrobiales bacterium]
MATYLITGATRGIGRAVVDVLADDDLILLARDASALERLTGQLPSARSIAVDLARPADLETALAGDLPVRLDGIVHAAGLNINGRLSDVGTEEWIEQLVVNVVAVAELNRLLLPALRAAQGTVVFVNSGAGRAVKRAGGTAYAASKHALVALADGLRLEEPDLRVTTVFPGRVATEMQKDLRAYEGGDYRAEDYVHPTTLAQVVAGALRLPSDASMTDVAVMPNG